MTDESELLRRLIEAEVVHQLGHKPFTHRQLAGRVAEEVMHHLQRFGVQVVRLHANGAWEE